MSVAKLKKISRTLAKPADYTCHIAVEIPKTAIGVTAILPTAISVTAMAAKTMYFSGFLDHFL